MSATSPVHSFLLARFAAFYEEVARIKVAIDDDTLVAMLRPDNPHADIEPHEMAERVAIYLLGILDKQLHEVTNGATETELAAYMRTRYVMTALADEIFILNVKWAASEHWPEFLLEHTLQRSRIAGRQFFVLAQEAVDCRAPLPLDIEFAAVLLLALQLGFQGMYRGEAGKQTRREFRNKVYKLASIGELGERREHVFAQAYDYTVVYDRDNTRVALGPWVRAAVYGALIYVVISSAVWLVLTWSPLGAIGRIT
jgi:type VI secretion system protein ImpK